MGERQLKVVHDEFEFEQDDEQDDVEGVRADERDWYFASTDRHGHGVTTHVKHPPQIGAQVSQLAQNPRTPYRTTADVWRDAIMHHLVEMADWLDDGGFSAQVEVLTMLGKSETSRIGTQTKAELVESCVEAIEAAFEIKDTDALRDALEHGRMVCEAVDVDTTKLLNKIKEREGG